MANVTETSTWEIGIYQLETTDPVEGGALGISNTQAKQLGNRTKWLKDQIFPGELKWLNGKNALFISANFPGGLGTGIYTGWAIANGSNGTTDMSGLTPVAYGGFFSVINATGGSKDAVLVSHNHTYSQYVQSGSNEGSGGEAAGFFATGTTSTVGESGTSKNMQPYRVVLCIQKI